jgi:mannose-6-phosphate isomerase-like protein (cupin superfamily)
MISGQIKVSHCQSHSSVIVSKPWGYEYLVYENEHVAVWLLCIRSGEQTSMHCHPKKTTGLVLLTGTAELSLLDEKKILSGPEKQVLRRGLFHSTKAISNEPIILLEIESPNDKQDLLRLSDIYGRADKSYEGSEDEVPKPSDVIWISDVKNGDQNLHTVGPLELKIECISSMNSIMRKADNDIVIFLRGGIGKIVNGVTLLSNVSGDVENASILKKIANEMNFIQDDTLLLTVGPK